MVSNYNTTFIHISDLHIGFKFKNASFSLKRGEDRRRELKETLYRVLDVVKKENIDFLFIAGDTFESEYITRSELDDICYNFAKNRSVQIIIIAGNHDPLSCVKIYKKTKWPANVHIAGREFSTFVFEEKKVAVTAVSFSEEYKKPLDFNEVPKPKQDYKNVLLLHGNAYNNDNYCYIDKNKLSSLGYDYIGLGHIHKQDFIDSNIAYSGSLEPLDFGETGHHGYILGNLTSTEYSHVPFSKRRFIKVDIELTGEDVISSVMDKIASATRGMENDFIRITLKGSKPNALTITREDILRNHDFYYVEINDESRQSVSIEEIIEQSKNSFISEFIDVFTKEELEDELYEEAYKLGINMLYEDWIR